MLRFLKAAASTTAALTVLSAGPVSAQLFGRWNNNSDCGCNAPVAPAMMSAAYTAPTVTACTACAPVVQQTACVPLQPVMQTVYRQVPVTEYQPVKEMAKKQVFETKYVDQAVTEYRPITETKVVDVPTVSYQNVTENQVQYRNTGYWRTRTDCVNKAAPCQVDSRPGFAGWMNRTSYELTSAFTPNTRSTREYVPQMMACNVASTRQVAVQGSRQVSYNVTRMEPYQTTRRVAVSEPRWVDTEITVMKPYTVVKTMAVGTQVTFAPLGAGTTATALGPVPDPNMNRRADALDKSDPSRVNDRTKGAIDGQPILRERIAPTNEPEIVDPRRLLTDTEMTDSPYFAADFVDLGRSTPLPYPSKLTTITAAKPVSAPTFQAPGAARAAQWVARTPKSPSLAPVTSALSVADTDQP
ncbi:hypothetical protein GC163_13980 [bacterium]|nr:hypothetical protein [bacterium]